jgi:RAD54-like protein 2
MYDNIVESLQHFQTTAGLGCILAHSMGCGKTVQVITFIDILLQYTAAKLVLIVVPINTIQNWLNEFNRWCPLDNPNIEYKRLFQLYILNETSKKFTQRTKMVQNWSQTGGVLIMGYEMFRLLVTKKNSSTTKMNRTSLSQPTTTTTPPPVIVDLEEEEKNFETMEGKRSYFLLIAFIDFCFLDIRNALINPDLVICDEGHRIKNHQASVAVALKSIRTQFVLLFNNQIKIFISIFF